ncbi:hypothetical protein [Microbacterium sp. W4I20]|nr:hypothetical protein [Microbacterium sp. W4I20]
MQHRVNRWELRKMQIRYWLWWKWVPIPTAMIGALIGVGLFNGAVALFGW